MRAGRVADLDAVQLGGCAGSNRYTGQRRLMTGKMHDVFIVISEGGYGEHIARTFYAADLRFAAKVAAWLTIPVSTYAT